MKKTTHKESKIISPALDAAGRQNAAKHKRRALVITLIIELLLIAGLATLHFPRPQVPATMEINLVDDDFDFSELQPPPKTEIPDISPYLNQNEMTTLASNEWQEETSETENTPEEQETEEEETDRNTEALTPQLSPDQSALSRQTKPTSTDEITSFKGKSRIRYYVKGRHKTYLENPIYTCPDYMHGWVTISIVVDREGKVVQAAYDPQSSGTSYECLVDAALRAARRARFNRDATAPAFTRGYIKFLF